jgi:hypothetical protein
MKCCAIYHLPWAGPAGFSCAAACDARVANILSFVKRMFDLPLAVAVLHADETVTALAVDHTTVKPLFLRRFENPID